MPSEKKIKVLKDVKKQLKEYQVVGILDMHKLPAKQLHEIRNKLREKVVIRTVKKKIMIRALKGRLEGLETYIQGEPALLLTKENPFKIAKILSKSKSEAPAKSGDIAPRDIVIKEGPTNLPPGPAIGDLQRVKIPAGVEGDKIVVKKDTTIVKKGEVIESVIADILTKLNITPMEIGLNLIAVWENNIIYDKDILFVPDDYYINKLNSAVSAALNLSVNVNYITKDNINLLLGKAHKEAESLAREADIITPQSIKGLISKANIKAKALDK